MGAFLEKPKTEKYNESKSGAGLRYGLFKKLTLNSGNFRYCLGKMPEWNFISFNTFFPLYGALKIYSATKETQSVFDQGFQKNHFSIIDNMHIYLKLVQIPV